MSIMSPSNSEVKPDAPPSVERQVYVLGQPGCIWHPLRDREAGITLCGVRADWVLFTTIAPDPLDLCPACARLGQLLGLLERGAIQDVTEWATSTMPWEAGRDVLPWLREREGQRAAPYVLQPSRLPWWRQLLRRLGR